MTRLLRSTAVRLALGYATIFILSSMILVGLLWWRTTAYLDREVDAVILADTQAVGDRLRDFGLPGAIETINERVGKAGDERAIYLLTDPALVPVAGNLDAWPLEIGHSQGWHQIQLTFQGRIHPTRVLYVVLPSGFHLLVGRDVEDRATIRRSILDGLGWTAAAALLLAVTGGLLLRGAILRRVDALTLTTTAIIRGDLSNRLPTRDTHDEFDRLAQTINGMLQQIEVLVDGVRNASNAVAHDLRTPLAELRGRLEALLRSPPSAETTLQEVGGAVADLDRVIGIFNALLRLAEIDSGARLSGFREVQLDEIAAEVAEMYEPVAEQNAISLTLNAAPGLTVFGDPFLLAQAIGNLVDNALKYCPAHGSVALTAARLDEGGAEITVSDNGPGIADAEKSRVTERFYRGDANRDAAGAGLGLSLVAAVGRLHGGNLTLADACPGLIAKITLPSCSASTMGC
ncbi:MAG TPA: HAMP domain-containing sensor histidine kinase [Patescibacteria group bacterium]|nr:HAMP domain-containing sensor histidine kinase [Patescibacteria group bacterium]